MDALESTGAVTASQAQEPDGPLLHLIKDRRVAFLAVGAVNTIVGFVLFAFFHAMWGNSRWLLTLLCSHVISVVIAFVLYRYLVFRVRGHLLRDAWRFETVYLSGLAINAVLLAIGVDWFHLDALLVQVFVMIFTAIWSYVGHGRFSFHRKDAS